MSAITPEPPAAAYARLRAADERAGGLSLDEREALLLALTGGWSPAPTPSSRRSTPTSAGARPRRRCWPRC
jgi:hypothetical protein